jgi:hypothetical protein
VDDQPSHESQHRRGGWENVHPDFDGHLSRPFARLTSEERLQWLWEVMLLRWSVRKQLQDDRPV